MSEPVQLKCHWCQKELQTIDSEQEAPAPGLLPKFTQEAYNLRKTITLECPDVHCSVIYSRKDKRIIEYTIFVDHNNKRYKIRGLRNTSYSVFDDDMIVDGHSSPKTQFLVKTGRFSYSNALTINRYLSFKPNKEGVLQAESIFKKLKTLQIFS